MSDIPVIADTDRVSTATLSASVGPVTVGFPVFGGADDIEVYVDGVLVPPEDWTLTSDTALDPDTDILPAGDGRVTFDSPQTGDVMVVGERKPHRSAQFTPGVGIPAEAHNTVYSWIEATLRELFAIGKAALKLRPGERSGYLPAAADRALKLLSFDAAGKPVAEYPIDGITGPPGQDGKNYAGTSTTSNAIADTGSQVFTTQAGLAYTVGARVRASDAANPAANWMEGVVTDYTGATLTFTADLKAGSGTLTNWTFNIAGVRGAPGSGDMTSTNNLSDLASKKAGYDTISVHGADVASASTIDLDAATGVLIDVTGTTTITAITLSEGRERVVRFTGALTLTNGASLVLPGGANITTAAGDFAVLRGYAAGVVRCVVYAKANGKPVVFPSLADLSAIGQGKHTIWIPASAMIPRTTNGAAAGTAEMTTNKNMVKTLDFDTSTQEFAQFEIAMPKSWNLGTITFQPVWSHASTTTNFGVVWALQAVATSDDDALDVAFGTEQTSTDTGGTTNDRYIGPESSAITVAGSPAAGDVVQFQIKRNPSDGSDTMAVDARLHGVKLYITLDAATDA